MVSGTLSLMLVVRSNEMSVETLRILASWKPSLGGITVGVALTILIMQICGELKEQENKQAAKE